MKKYLLLQTALLVIVFTATLTSCAKQGIKQPVTLDKAAGRWYIHGIRYQIFNGSPTPQDSTVPQRPILGNYVTFDGTSGLQYCYNESQNTPGTYSFIGQDSIQLTINSEVTRWKILLLTATNFNIENTSDNVHDFPGATVVTFQGFVK